MQLTSLAASLAVIGLATAVPTANSPATSTFTVSYVDKFDDITVLPVSIPETNQVGIYVGASQSCTIQIAGRKAASFGGTTAVKELVYNAGLLDGAYVKTTFPEKDFSNLDQISINVIGATGTTSTASPNFDNVAYVATFKK
ncbi:MAG: hypothetical protein GOMPHAMPRED_006538 [Gomphillus americanus]|uniref:Uncharacterized protein n=1 Tax=Gomphillus americanus TaxID=1940652 RepID=A0A8H3IYB6_9LECA|nr:MAG: hypothetical protein GOMPHAMPRED_006538 [Gomphillus americanus]